VFLMIQGLWAEHAALRAAVGVGAGASTRVFTYSTVPLDGTHEAARSFGELHANTSVRQLPYPRDRPGSARAIRGDALDVLVRPHATPAVRAADGKPISLCEPIPSCAAVDQCERPYLRAQINVNGWCDAGANELFPARLARLQVLPEPALRAGHDSTRARAGHHSCAIAGALDATLLLLRLRARAGELHGVSGVDGLRCVDRCPRDRLARLAGERTGRRRGGRGRGLGAACTHVGNDMKRPEAVGQAKPSRNGTMLSAQPHAPSPTLSPTLNGMVPVCAGGVRAPLHGEAALSSAGALPPSRTPLRQATRERGMLRQQPRARGKNTRS
jgi:hypothetical protein